ncbi:MAG: hypothetical protein B6U94_08150, partial [Thermofilum sp. ex4484_79]
PHPNHTKRIQERTEIYLCDTEYIFAMETARPEDVGLSSSRLSRLDEFLCKCIENGAFPGAVVLVGRRSRIVYHKAFGYSMITPRQVEMRKDTIFDLASLTKPIVAATLTMILVEEGVLRLDDKIIDLVSPGLAPLYGEGDKQKVSVLHLLTHTSGLPAWLPLYSYCSSRDEVFRYVIRMPLKYPPGDKVVYSDLGIILLTYIIEYLTGKRIDVLARDLIFNPLGMNDTTYNPSKEVCHTEGLNDRRGIGWALKTRGSSCGDLFSDRSYGHTGFTGTSLWIDPEEELFVVFLTNRVHPTRENRAILRIRPLLHNIVASSIRD